MKNALVTTAFLGAIEALGCGGNHREIQTSIVPNVTVPQESRAEPELPKEPRPPVQKSPKAVPGVVSEEVQTRLQECIRQSAHPEAVHDCATSIKERNRCVAGVWNGLTQEYSAIYQTCLEAVGASQNSPKNPPMVEMVRLSGLAMECLMEISEQDPDVYQKAMDSCSQDAITCLQAVADREKLNCGPVEDSDVADPYQHKP